MLLFDRTRPSEGNIVQSGDISAYETHHVFLQRASGLIEFEDFIPGSIFVFDAQRLPNPRHEWFLADDIRSMSIGVRVGSVVILAALGDGGAQETEEEVYSRFYDLALHPLQIKELFALVFYKSSRATRTPKYIQEEAPPFRIWQLPLGGYSSVPFFDNYDVREYAKVLSQFTGVPLNELLYPPDRVRTWLQTDAGQVQFIPIN